MKLLVTGADGQLGRELLLRGPAAGLRVRGVNREQLDIASADAIRMTLAETKPELVINAAAYTKVDAAENEAELAFAVNRDGVRLMAEACRDARLPMVHVSTDYVFAGQSDRPYREDDPAAPINVYGASKWAGEQALRETLDRHIIVRTSWVFGAHGANFVKTIVRLARERERLTVVADQHGMPTHAGDLAEVLLALARRAFSSDSVFGTYHYAGWPVTSWHGFATEICAQAGQIEPLAVKQLLAVTSAEYPTAAARPPRSMLDCSRLQALGLAPRPWRDGLAEVLKVILTSAER